MKMYTSTEEKNKRKAIKEIDRLSDRIHLKKRKLVQAQNLIKKLEDEIVQLNCKLEGNLHIIQNSIEVNSVDVVE